MKFSTVMTSVKRLISLFFIALLLTSCYDGLPDGKVMQATGRLVNIKPHGTDIVFTLDGDGNAYYINRGLDHGMSIEKLQALMLNDTITIKYDSRSIRSVPIDTLLYKDSIVHTLQGW